METAFVSLICIVLMVIGGMTMSQGFLNSIDNTSSNIEVISQRDQDIMRTNIMVLTAAQTSSDSLMVSLRNTGQIKLSNFEKWDVILHYVDTDDVDHIVWLPFTQLPLEDNQWCLEGIYMDASGPVAEVFEPGLVNTDEEMVIECKLDPPVKAGSINLVSVTTPNAVSTSKSFLGFQP